jgi:hypothetical protein
MSLQSLALNASVAHPYHPPKHSDAPTDVLLAVIAAIILLLFMIVPPVVAKNREDRRLAAEAPVAAPTAPSAPEDES